MIERFQFPFPRAIRWIPIAFIAHSACLAESKVGDPSVAHSPTVPSGLNRGEALETKFSKSISAVYTYKVFSPLLKASEWTLFTPRPPILGSQRILSFESAPRGEIVVDQSPLKQSILRVHSTAKTTDQLQSTSLTVRIDADLYSRRLVRSQESSKAQGVSALKETERALFLRQSAHFDYQSPVIARWMEDHDFHRHPDEGEIAFARRVFQFIARNFQYEYLGNQNRSASNVCRVGKSDCGGLAVLFCTVMRSQGIPARTLAGRWAVSEKPDEKIGKIAYHQEHVKGEFFAQGVGWVPVDLSSAVLHDRSPEKLTFFGNDRGDFLTLHLDNDLRLDTGTFGVRPVTLLQRPCYWVAGRGSTDNAAASESWNVTLRNGAPE